ncbi:putative cytochrome c [Sphingobium sp. SYK-6]|uniref:c-type cytochrome n=1 Tax=Sphingobium sp. (strain NBRC 103272 / SYK-6) TaxID=627192 RepID=UPI000227702F|nr:cytochrome c [Sphingobium sp. SYK-6]BAK67456.1 putative cytochrome c [Sphingobium sp. SYK-6]
MKARVRTAGAFPLALLPLVLAACGQQAPDQKSDAAKAGPPPPPPPLTAAARPDATGGERLYIQHCGMCHGPGGMGSGLLARRTDEPLLEARKDLDVDYVVQAARTGIGNMPPIPRGEVSDAEMQQIATYLASGKGPAAP